MKYIRSASVLLVMMVLALGSVSGAQAPNSTNSRIPEAVPVKNLPIADSRADIVEAPTAMSSALAGTLGAEDRFVGHKVGSTWYDYQHNGTMGRQIAQGGDGRVHFVWMHKPNGTAGSGNRAVFYNSAIFSGGQWVLSHDTSGTDISSLRGGYCNVGVWGDKAVPAWHEGLTEDSYSTYSGIDFASGTASFTTSAAPVDYTCSADQTNSDDEPFNYLWPIIAVDETGTGADPIIMAVTCESVANNGDDQSMVYFRGTGIPTNYGSCGVFIDTVMDISPLVRQDPNSDEVAMAWLRPRGDEADYSQYNNDVMVMYSNDNGQSWGTPINITDYAVSDPNRPYSDMTGIFTGDGCFHLVWSSLPNNEASGTYEQLGNLEHWDDCSDCITTLIQTDNYNPECGGPGRWNTNVAKPNLVECQGRLYCTYTYFKDDAAAPDCSAGGWANGELYAQVSTTGGAVWGPPTNLSNTPDNGCAAGDCESEHWASAAMYGDSLYILYVGDTDAGGWAGGSSGYEGTAQEDPLMFLVHSCFPEEDYFQLWAAPAALGSPYPLSVQEFTQLNYQFSLFNGSNQPTPFVATVDYLSGSGWLALDQEDGTVPMGCDNEFEITATITAPAAGYYEAEIQIAYADQQLTVPVRLWSWQVQPPAIVSLRTEENRLSVSADGGAGCQVNHGGFNWFEDDANYLFDGGLILGNSQTAQYDFNVFHAFSQQPTPDNPWGRLSSECCPTVDSLCDGSGLTYRYMTSSGVNHDGTIQFDFTWYASCQPDSAEFYVLHMAVGPGPNYSAPINHVVVAYACDWDVPSDTMSDNRGFADASEQTIYQQGLYPGSPQSNEQRFAGLAYRGHTEANEYAAGGEIWDNRRYIYPQNGYHVDTLQARLPGMNGWSVNVPDSSANGDDLNAVLVIDSDATISNVLGGNPEFNLIFWSINPNTETSQSYEFTLNKAERFICDYVSPDAPCCNIDTLCGDDPSTHCFPGQVNGDWLLNITDAVYLIQYIFNSGPAPRPWSICSGDVNGDCMVNITDVVALIGIIFPPGPGWPVTCEHFRDQCADAGVHNPF